MWKEYKALISLIVLIVPATAGAIWHFAPVSYADKILAKTEANTVQIAMMSESQQLKWMQSELNEDERRCVEKKTDEWLCSEKKKDQYDMMILDINILRLKLGLDPLEGD